MCRFFDLSLPIQRPKSNLKRPQISHSSSSIVLRPGAALGRSIPLIHNFDCYCKLIEVIVGERNDVHSDIDGDGDDCY